MADSDSTPGKAPAFQFYPGDFITGTLTLTTEEVGAYTLLICHAWDNGSIPSDVEKLARIARLSVARMRRAWTVLEEKFRLRDGGGGYIQPRLEREREKQRQWREKSASGGRKAQASRKGGSRVVQPPIQPIGQPNGNSSVFGFQSSDSSQSERKERAPITRVGSGVMAGTLPRDHLNCRPPCVRVCLTEKQHAILRERHGGTDADLDAFYADVRARLDPSQPVGETPWKFWEAQFGARFGTGAVNPRTAGNPAAAARFVARGAK